MCTRPRARLAATLMLAGIASAAAAATLLAAPRLARAQTADGDPAARAQFNEGLERYAAQDFEGARVAFEQAYGALHAVDILFNLALAELRSNRPIEAYAHLVEYLKDERPSAEERTKARRFLEEARAKTARVLIVAPAGAEVKVDGVARGVAPFAEPLAVMPGKHVLVGNVGGQTQSVELVVGGGDVVTALFPAPPEKAPEPAPPPEPVPPPPSGPRWGVAKTVLVMAVGTAATGALAAALGFKVGQSGARSDAQALSDSTVGVRCGVESAPPACARAADLKSTYDSDRRLAGVFFVTSGVLAAGAVAAALLWPNDGVAGATGGRVVPVVTAGEWSLAWAGRF